MKFLRNTLRERGDTYVTTLFDLYGLRSDVPGVEAYRTRRLKGGAGFSVSPS